MKKILKKDWFPYYCGTLVIHIIGFSFLFIASARSPFLLGLGILAYTLGLRHAFDADHIAAIDNTVRKLIQQKKKPQGVGFYFSLGHSTVVFLMAVALGLSVSWAEKHLPLFEQIGGIVGSVISGAFLILIAVFNLFILFDLEKMFRKLKRHEFDQQKFEDLLLSRGFLAKLFGPLFKLVNSSWQIYTIGFLFGLGFDTATEVALLALSAGAAKSNLSMIGLLALPILFAAGMNVMDTTDSVMMSGAYTWAFDTPVRKVYYNLTITSASVLAAVCIGVVELLQVAATVLNLKGNFWSWLQRIDFNWLGYALVILFIGFWGLSYFIWKHFQIEQRWNQSNL
ncbi:MAG: HoxN/HupN/NixA family nickel/cobalt transporter [Sporolactobacillus sp.]